MSEFYEERDWDFSFCATEMRETGAMRFRFRDSDGTEVKVERLAGEPYVVGDWLEEKGKRGHMKLRGELTVEVKNGQRVGYVECYNPPPAPEYEVKEVLPWEHVRVCANLGVNPGEEDKPRWRLHNELADPSQDWLWVENLEGRMNLTWFDKGSHVFNEGKIAVDTNGVGHFVG